MNVKQKKLAKRTKLVRQKTGLPWNKCKWIARSRAMFEFVKTCC